MNKVWRILLPAMLLCIILAGCGGKGGNESGKEYVPGDRSETEYSSEWAGLRYKLGSDMVMATDEELNNMMELGADALGDSAKMKAELAKLTSVYEMMAVNMNDQSNIIICTEKLSLSNMTEKQYLDAVKTQTEELYQDYSITYSDGGEREVCGLQFSEMGYVVDYGGVTLHQTYLVRKIDNRMYGIILSYADEATLDTLLAGFSAY